LAHRASLLVSLDRDCCPEPAGLLRLGPGYEAERAVGLGFDPKLRLDSSRVDVDRELLWPTG
jgi:hypothetical protein